MSVLRRFNCTIRTFLLPCRKFISWKKTQYKDLYLQKESIPCTVKTKLSHIHKECLLHPSFEWEDVLGRIPLSLFLLLKERAFLKIDTVSLLILGCTDPAWSVYGSSAVSQETSYGITNIPPSRETSLHNGTQVSEDCLEKSCEMMQLLHVHKSTLNVTPYGCITHYPLIISVYKG